MARHFQFSLRLLLLCVLTFCAGWVLWTKRHPWTIRQNSTFQKAHGASKFAGGMETHLLAKLPTTDKRFLAGFSLMEGSPPREIRSYGKCRGATICVAMSPTRVAIGTNLGEILLCDLETGEHAVRLTQHGDYVRSLCFSPDGRMLASVGTDHRLFLLDASTGAQIKELKRKLNEDDDVDLADDATCLRFSSDGKRLMAVGAEFRIWNVVDATLAKRFGMPFTSDSPVFWDELKGTVHFGTWHGRLVDMHDTDGSIVTERTWHEKHVHGLDLLNNDVVTAGCDGIICIGRLNENEPYAKFIVKNEGFRAPLFLNHNRVVVATDDGRLFEVVRLREDGINGFLLLPELYFGLILLCLLIREIFFQRKSTSSIKTAIISDESIKGV